MRKVNLLLGAFMAFALFCSCGGDKKAAKDGQSANGELKSGLKAEDFKTT